MLVAALSAAAVLMFQAAGDIPPLRDAPDAPAGVRAQVDTPLGHDSRGRPTIDACFNGHPPVRMVVDTAAQTSLVTASLAQELRLPTLGQGMTVNGVAGQSQAGLYGVDRFKTDLFEAKGVALLEMVNAGVTEARGIIGMEMFSNKTLIFDMKARRLSLGPSEEKPEGFAAVPGRLNEVGLLVVPVDIDGVVFDALIDTGAGVSVVSGGGLRALGWAETDPRLKPAGTIQGATLHQTAIRSGRVGRIKLGPVSFTDIALIFADEPGGGEEEVMTSEDSAEHPGATGRPSLILGSDLLTHLDAFGIDFEHAELLIRVPR